MNRRTLTASLALATLLVAPAAEAATYRVRAGTTYPNLASVAGRLNPGDVVEVEGGATYPSVQFTRAGTAAMPITIRGITAGGLSRPVLSGGTNTIELAGNNYVVENFDITGGSSRCVFHHADNVVLRNVVVHDCPRQGILGADQDSGDLLLEYSEVHHCGGGTQDHQIYMATDEVAYPGSTFRMQFCYVHDANGGNAVKSRAERNEIYYNWIEGALYHELELIGPDPDGAPDGWTEATAREDSDVVGNVLRATAAFALVRVGGDGTGQSLGRYRFVNNTFISNMNGSAVMRVFDGLESIEMHNNVFFATAGTVNVSRTVEAMFTMGTVFEGDTNWVTAGSTNVPAGFRRTTMGASPGFTSFAMNDLRPAAGSPLLDAGVATTTSPAGRAFPRPLALPLFHPPARVLLAPGTATPRPSNGAIDLGAYEGGGGGVPPVDAMPMPDAAIDVVMPRDVVAPTDVVVPPDAASPMDAALPADAGARPDVVMAMDTGPGPIEDVVRPDDVAFAPDAPSDDAAPTVDVAAPSDAPDVSTAAPDAANDARAADASRDGGTGAMSAGCGCATPGALPGRNGWAVFALAGAAAVLRRGRRR